MLLQGQADAQRTIPSSATIKILEVRGIFSIDAKIQCPSQIISLFYYKIISMWFCNVTISLSSTPYDILGEMFKLKL